MRVVLLRVGIDGGAGGMQGPLLRGDAFDFVPMPDRLRVDSRTYGSLRGRHGHALVDYFPPGRREAVRGQRVHVDPEFETFTYGDPTGPKAGLRLLAPGDLLVFYCGLEGWGDVKQPPALYLIGYFEVEVAGIAATLEEEINVHEAFGANFHVRNSSVYKAQRGRLLLIKGRRDRSRLLDTAVCVSEVGADRRGRPLKVLSEEMRAYFGHFGGRCSIQRSNPRWVDEEHAEAAASFVRGL